MGGGWRERTSRAESATDAASAAVIAQFAAIPILGVAA